MGDPGEDPPLFLDQTEAQRPKKNFFQDHPRPPYPRVWMMTSPLAPLSEGLDPPLQVQHILFLISFVVFSLQG